MRNHAQPLKRTKLSMRDLTLCSRDVINCTPKNLPCETPPKALSTMKAVTLSVFSPVLGSTTGVWAKTVKISAMPPLEIQILDPFKIQVLPSGESSARVLIEPASDLKVKTTIFYQKIVTNKGTLSQLGIHSALMLT